MFENGKTLGNNEIPIEYYKKLWDILADRLVDVFNFSFQLEEMTTSQRQAINRCQLIILLSLCKLNYQASLSCGKLKIILALRCGLVGYFAQ